MRIALVNVPVQEGNNVFPPLGLLYLAGALRAAGHVLLVLDEDPRRTPDLAGRIAAFRPEIVGFSFLTMSWDRASELVVAVRARLPGVLLVGGGAHATADPTGTLESLALDAVVVGEGEIAMCEIAHLVSSGGSIELVAGVVTRTGKGPERVPVQDLDELPFPARDLLGHAPYLRPPGLIRGWASQGIASMLGGRGCPFKCSYCASHQQLGRRVRMRSPGNIVAELEMLKRVDDIRGIYWVDDVFTHDRAWALEVCAAIAPLGLHWGCQSRADAVDGALLRAMRDAGCVQIDVGVESGSSRILKAMHKGVSPEQYIDAFDLIHAAGLRTGASFIVGYPGETEEEIRATQALAKRLRSEWTVFFFATPYPGTELWRKTVKQQGESWPAWGESWNNRVGPEPFIRGEVPPDRVAWWRSQLQNQHFRTNYLRRRNLPFIAQLAQTLPRPAVRKALRSFVFTGGRADDVVEAAFSEWRVAG